MSYKYPLWLQAVVVILVATFFAAVSHYSLAGLVHRVSAIFTTALNLQ